jgi:thioredoxin 1
MKKSIYLVLLVVSVTLGVISCKSNAADENIVTLTTDNFNEQIATGVVMVDFWASWCMPCKAMAPVIDEIASQTTGKIKVGKVDIDKNGPLARQFGIQAIPTLVIFKDGKQVETLVGMQSKESIVQALSKYAPLQ